MAHPLAVSIAVGILGLLGYFAALFRVVFAGIEKAALGFGTGSSGTPPGAFAYLSAILPVILAAGGFVFAAGVAVVTYRAVASLRAKGPTGVAKA